MMAMRTANPALNEKVFSRVGTPATAAEAMSIQGTVNKSVLMLVLVLLTAGWTWNRYFAAGDLAAIAPWTLGGALGGFVVAMVTIFKKSWAPVTAPIYALLEGLLLGGLSAIFEAQYPGIVIQAVGLTFGTLLALLAAYKSGIIRVTERFRLGVVAATGGIALIYVASMLLGFFGVNVPYIHESGVIGIGFSVFVVIVAALNLVLDFDLIETGAERSLPKYMEWYAAFALMITLIWLYIEILRLLAKLQRRR